MCDPSHVLEVEDLRIRGDLLVEDQPVGLGDIQTGQLRGKSISLVHVIFVVGEIVRAHFSLSIYSLSLCHQFHITTHSTLTLHFFPSVFTAFFLTRKLEPPF